MNLTKRKKKMKTTTFVTTMFSLPFDSIRPPPLKSRIRPAGLPHDRRGRKKQEQTAAVVKWVAEWCCDRVSLRWKSRAASVCQLFNLILSNYSTTINISRMNYFFINLFYDKSWCRHQCRHECWNCYIIVIRCTLGALSRSCALLFKALLIISLTFANDVLVIKYYCNIFINANDVTCSRLPHKLLAISQLLESRNCCHPYRSMLLL